MDIADRKGSVLRRVLLSAERFRDAAISRGSSRANTPGSRSRALLVLVTCCIFGIILVIPYIGTVALLPLYVALRALSLEFLAQFGPEWTMPAEAADPDSPPAPAPPVAPPPEPPSAGAG